MIADVGSRCRSLKPPAQVKYADTGRHQQKRCRLRNWFEFIAVIEEGGVLLKEVHRGVAAADKLLLKQQRPSLLLGGA